MGARCSNALSAYGEFCCLLIIFAEIGPRSRPTECWSCSGTKLFDTLMVFLKEFFEKVNFAKKRQRTTTKSMKKLPGMQRGN